MDVERTSGDHSARAKAVCGARLHGLRDANLLRVFHGDDWWSVLAAEESSAWLHVVAPERIGSTSWFDSLPWWNYGGELLVNPTGTFLRQARDAYQDVAPTWNLAADVCRFDPIGDDAESFRSAGVDVADSRPVVYAEVKADEEAQVESYRGSARRQVARAAKELDHVGPDPGKSHVAAFAELMRTSLHALGAERRWRLYERLHLLELVSSARIWLITHAGRPVAGALGIVDGGVGHCVLVGRDQQNMPPGAADYLMHRVIRGFAAQDVRFVCLGGGRTPGPDDSLLRFKQKFSDLEPTTLSLGLLAQEKNVVDQLCRDAPPNSRTDTAVFDSVARTFLPHRRIRSLAPAGSLPWP